MATNIVDRPPPWVYQRIIAVGGQQGPRYEASLYGPTNCFLVPYFPISRHFMVKPQAKIRPEFINNFDPTIRISLDSYHAEVLPRSIRGSEIGVKIPDFIVVKATQSKDDDKLLLVVEIKTSDQSLNDSAEQLVSYLEAFAEKYRDDTEEPLFRILYGLLLVGEKVKLYTFHIDGRIGTTGLLDITSPTVHSFLNNIATTNL